MLNGYAARRHSSHNRSMSADRNIARVTATAAVHAGRTTTNPTPPIDLSATYYLPGVDAGGESYDSLVAGGPPTAEGGLVYQRMWNPTTAGFEQALAELEGLPEAVSFASGMAAITACLLAATADPAAGGKRHIVALRPIYGGTDGLLSKGTLGTEVTWVDGPADIAPALAARPDTALVVVETPANPTARLLDLDAVAAACGDVPYLVDSTFATPVLQQPARHGATLVVHSATKYLGGHSRRARRRRRDHPGVGRAAAGHPDPDRRPAAPARRLPAAPRPADAAAAGEALLGDGAGRSPPGWPRTRPWSASTTPACPAATRTA